MNRQTIFRLVLGVIVAAGLVAAGFALFNAGTAYGVAQSPEWARLMEQRMETGGAGLMPGGQMGMRGMMGFGRHMGGWGAGWGMGWGFGIFGVIGLFVKLILFFIVLRLIFGVAFGWRRWGWHGGGPGGPGGWEQRGREKFEEWHKQAHSGTEPPQTPTPSQ